MDELDRTVTCVECHSCVQCVALPWGWDVRFTYEVAVVPKKNKKKEKTVKRRIRNFLCPKCSGALAAWEKLNECG